jgi:hypothetical protein
MSADKKKTKIYECEEMGEHARGEKVTSRTVTIKWS